VRHFRPSSSDNDVKNRYHCWMKRNSNAEKRRKLSRTAPPSLSQSPATPEGHEVEEVESEPVVALGAPAGGSSGSVGPVLVPASRQESVLQPAPSQGPAPDHDTGRLAEFLSYPHTMPQQMLMQPSTSHFPPSVYGPPHMFSMGFQPPPPAHYFAPPPPMYYPGQPFDPSGMMSQYMPSHFGYYGPPFPPHMYAAGPSTVPQAYHPHGPFPPPML
jgi:hypothetical protein